VRSLYAGQNVFIVFFLPPFQFFPQAFFPCISQIHQWQEWVGAGREIAAQAQSSQRPESGIELGLEPNGWQ
jgi:hypothetical protein